MGMGELGGVWTFVLSMVLFLLFALLSSIF